VAVVEFFRILGTGTLIIRSSVNGNTSDFRIPGVSLVKTARHTLLSARQLLQPTDLTFTAEGTTGTLTREGKLVFPLSIVDGLYTVQGELIPRAMANVAVSSTSPGLEGKLWHARLGHASAGVMHILAKRGLIPSTAHGPQNIAHCKGCAAGKAKLLPREGKPESRGRTEAGDILRADPTGMGKISILSVMDACSKYVWAFPLQQKNEAAGKLKALILHLRARGKSVHTLRSDHCGEFTSEFGWLEAQGIRHEFSPSYVHKTNGLIERFHGTILPRLRAVVHEHQVPLGTVPTCSSD
jgi:hypothetical protein